MSTLTSLQFVTHALRHGDAAKAWMQHAVRQAPPDWRQIIWLAGQHWVLPTLAASMHRHGVHDVVPVELWEAMESVRLLNRERNQMLRQSLVEISAALNEAGIEPLLLKGANALLPDVYPDAEDRMLGDLDLHLPEAAHPAATAALVDLGYREAEEAWQMMLLGDRRGHHHGIPLLHTSRPVKVELHRRVLKCPEVSRR
jgi:hypothetical protein